MADTEASVPPKHKEKRECKFGATCRRRNCKFSHPPPPPSNELGGAHDSPVQSESMPETNEIYADSQNFRQSDQHDVPKVSNKGNKPCKFGTECRRRKCPFLHPTEETAAPASISTSTDNTTSNNATNEIHSHGNRSLKTDIQGHGSGKERDEIHDTADAEDPTLMAFKKNNKASGRRKSKNPCFRGSKCRKPGCPYKHPDDHPLSDGQREDVTMIQNADTSEMPLAADLEESLVKQAQETQQHMEQDKHSTLPMEKRMRRGRRDKHGGASHRRQYEEDLLIQKEDRRLQQKAKDGTYKIVTMYYCIRNHIMHLTSMFRLAFTSDAAEQERLQLEEAEELDRMLQDQERQRQAEAEMEQQRLANADAERRLSAEKARIEIDLIRQGLTLKEQANREAQVLADRQKREDQALRDPERVRVEREALARFKRLHEEQKKSEEAARRLEEEERKMQEQQDELIRREREKEAKSHCLTKTKKDKDRGRSKEETNDLVSVVEEASKVQEENVPIEYDEERERYKAERKAAKKERHRLEKEARDKAEGSIAIQSPSEHQIRVDSQSPTGSNQENIFDTNSPESDAEDEAAKKRRWQEELKRQKERSVMKKQQKQKLRRERMLEDIERQTRERTHFWKAEIAEEKTTIELLVLLCAAEFCRINLDMDRQTLIADEETKQKLVVASQETYRAICKADIHSRVVVKGMKQQDLNDRTGTIQSWDESKGKFHVGLDTKKGKNTQYLYIPPANLEALPLTSPRNGKKKGDPVHMIFIASLYHGRELMVDVYKSELDGLKKADSIYDYLDTLMNDRDREEREAKELEEEERRQEEQARRRRAEQRHRENMEWQRRQEEYAEQKAEYQEWRCQQRKEKKASAKARERSERDYSEEREHSPYCECPRCEFEHMFFEGMGGSGRGPKIFFSFGADGPGIFFDIGDEDYDDEYEYQWDRQWEQMHEQELAEKNLEAAETLGVDVDASDAEIKRVFRKKARKYHPDSFRADNHEDGMTKEDAEEHFKELSNAYDHLMSNFDEDSDEE